MWDVSWWWFQILQHPDEQKIFWSLRVVWLSATGCPLTVCWRKFFDSIFYSWGIFPQRKGYVAGLNFHKQWTCGWLQLPSETNHLIKKKWADRIDADHFQCGDMSPQREPQQPVNTSVTWLQIKLWQGPPVHSWITLRQTRVSRRTLWRKRRKKLHHRCRLPVSTKKW